MGLKIGPQVPRYIAPSAPVSKGSRQASTQRAKPLGGTKRVDRSVTTAKDADASLESASRAAFKLLLESRGVDEKLSKQLFTLFQTLPSNKDQSASLLLKNVLFSAVDVGAAKQSNQLTKTLDMLIAAAVDGSIAGAGGLAAVEYFAEVLQRRRIRRKHYERLRRLIGLEPEQATPVDNSEPDFEVVTPVTVERERGESDSDIANGKVSPPTAAERNQRAHRSLAPIAFGVDPQQWPSTIGSSDQAFGLNCQEFTQALFASSAHTAALSTAEQHAYRSHVTTVFLSYSSDDVILFEDGVKRMREDKVLTESDLGWGIEYWMVGG